MSDDGLRTLSGPVALFPNGMCMAFDRGDQIPELQKSWICLWAENAVANGFNPDGVVVTIDRKPVGIVRSEHFGWRGEVI